MPNPTPLLDRKDLSPSERARIGRATSDLLAALLASVAILGSLAIWHLVRRGRVIRERLGPPRSTTLPSPDPTPPAPPTG